MDEKVKEQIINVSWLQGLKGYAFAMLDAHWGYGFPIGGVAAYDPEEGGMYLGAMNAAINVALCKRQMLTQLTRDAFEKIFPKADIKTLFDVSHNTCKAEKHTVNGKEFLLYVHRKGATRAFGQFHPLL